MPIPRILHQVWFRFGDGPDTPPREYDEMRNSWRILHPDWTIMEWDLEKSLTFLKKYYPEHLEMFVSYKKDIFRVDAIRYFILHHYGGFYVDSDTTALSSLDGLCKYKNVLCLNAYTKKIIHNNHAMGCERGSEFFKECILRLPAAALLQSAKDSYASVMFCAGPFFLTGVAMTYKRRKEIYSLSHEDEKGYFIHHENHSWKLSRNILGDIGRIGLILGGITTGAYLIGKAVKDRKLH